MKQAFCILLIVLCGCTPQRKLNRLLKKHPELITTDTVNVTVRDTIIIEEHRTDTVTQFRSFDTVTVINNERVEVRYYHDRTTDTIYHEARCKKDTLFWEKTVPIAVERIKYQPMNWLQRNANFLISIFALLILAFLLARAIGLVK